MKWIILTHLGRIITSTLGLAITLILANYVFPTDSKEYTVMLWFASAFGIMLAIEIVIMFYYGIRNFIDDIS